MYELFLNIYFHCGIKGASSHSGRRSLLTKLASKGVGVLVLAEIAGHAGINIVQKHIDANDEQMRAAIDLG
jgi:integrase/recombinase XerD